MTRIPPPAHRRGRAADHRGGWKPIFGGRASEPMTSRTVEKTQFVPTPPAYGAR